MKYLKIQNQGELDIRLVALMGGTTKIDNPHKIGQFGTGLKYAISWLVRNENKFKLFIGSEEVIFESRHETIGENSFQEIYCNGKSMSITTRYGYQWKGWEAIREIWCNAIDEGGNTKEIIEDEIDIDFTRHVIGNTTTIFIEVTEEIQKVLDEWQSYFLDKEPLFENEDFAVYLNDGANLKLYKNSILIYNETWYKSKFIYDFKNATLNELRQYIGSFHYDVAKCLLNSNKAVVENYFDIYKNGKWDFIEYKLDFAYVSYDKEKVKEIFDGYLYLHPESDGRSGNSSIKVTEPLFNILKDCGLPTEKIEKIRGRYYSGGGYGYYEDEEVNYKLVTNDVLQSKIDRILTEYGEDNIQYSIVSPLSSDFEILITEEDGILLNSDLFNYSTSDLEAVVLIAIFNNRDGNIYGALKRLIKYAKSNKAFKKIFFGKNIAA